MNYLEWQLEEIDDLILDFISHTNYLYKKNGIGKVYDYVVKKIEISLISERSW